MPPPPLLRNLTAEGVVPPGDGDPGLGTAVSVGLQGEAEGSRVASRATEVVQAVLKCPLRGHLAMTWGKQT